MDGKQFRNRILQERTNFQAILPPRTTHQHFQPTSLVERNINMNIMPFQPARDNILRNSSLNRVDNNGMLSIRTHSVDRKPLYSENGPAVGMARDGDVGESLDLKNVHHVYDERVERIQEASIFGPEYVDNKVTPPSHLTQPASNGEVNTRRRTQSARYLEAEQALTRLSQCYLQHADTSNGLKIDALMRATSILAAHAVDAREGAEKLRLLLADRQTEPTLFNSMQRQRWMEERRLLATEEVLKTARQHLSTLTSSPSLPPTSPVLPSTDASNHNTKSRANQNLAMFFDSSRRRLPNRLRRRAVATPPCPQKCKFEFPRIHHHKQLLPLRLKVPDFQPFPQPTTKKLTIVTQPLPAEHPHESHGSSPPTSSPSSAIPLNSPPPLETISEQPEAIDALPLTPASPSNSNGTAVIWPATTQRSTADILAGLVVAMPDYVGDLLAEFDASSSVNLPLDGLQAPFTPPNPPSILPPSLATPNASSPLLDKSPSRRRISGLFSLPDALSSRRGLGIPAQSRLSKSSSTPPALLATETIPEDPEDSSLPRLVLNPIAVSFSGLASAVTLNSASHDHDGVDAILEAGSGPERSEPMHAPVVDEKVLTRLRRRMSALRRH